MMRASNKVVIFLHIPKTAGTTFNDILKKNFSEEEFFDIYHYDYAIQKYRQLSPQDKEKLKIIKGHFSYGIHKLLEIPSYQYITILRDPVNRVISQYHHSLGTISDVYHDTFKKRNIKLENCMGEGLIPDNQQVRYLAGLTQVPFGRCNEKHLETAKKNLNRYFLFGISEMFDETLLWLKRFLPFHRILYMKKHVTYNRPRVHDYPAATINQLKDHNIFDIQFYEFARRKFRENLQGVGLSFREELKTFRNSLEKSNKITNDYFRGLKLLKEDRIEEALSTLRDLLAEEDLEDEIKGEVFFLLAQHDPQLDTRERNNYYRHSLQLFFKNKNYNRLNMYRIASLYKRLGEYKKAGKIFSEEINKQRNTDLVLIGGCYFHLGEMALEEKRTADAVHYFSQCLSANPHHKKAKEYLNQLTGK